MPIRHDIKSILAGAALASVGAIGAASAQDIQGFKPATGTWNYYSVDGVAVAAPGVYVPSLIFNYGRNPLVRRNANGDVLEKVIENLTTFDLMLAVGITDRIEVGIDVPFSYSVGSDSVPIDDGAGLGDLRLQPKFVLLKPEQAGNFGIAVATPMSFPTGENNDASSSRNFVFNPKLVLEYRGSKFRIGLNGGYRVRPDDGEALTPLTVGNGITYGGGVGVDVGSAVTLLAEVFGTQYENVEADKGGANPLETLLGARLYSRDTGLTMTLGAGVGLINSFGAPEFRALGGVAWSSDSMKDDRVILAGGGGIDDGDDDQDGVRNFTDACPKEKEDRDGFQDADGCPDIDNDLDGIVDADDKCPVNAEDMDAFEDEDGCPEIDNDKDGIADQLDRCPSEPETKNGHRDEDGCPDGGLVIVEAGQIKILKKIYFDTGKDSIKPISFGVLNQVAEVLQYNAKIETIAIEGHTDTRGSDKANRTLSEKRAAAVLQYLLGQGIAATRLSANGYGEDRLATTDDSITGHAQNRRVEFKIGSRTDLAADGSVAPVAVVVPEDAPAEVKAAAQAGRVGKLTSLSLNSTPETLSFTFEANVPLEIDRIETMLDDGGKVLIMRVANLKSVRAWQSQLKDQQVVRSLVFPSQERRNSTALRVRLTDSASQSVLDQVKLAASGNTVTVIWPRPAAQEMDLGAPVEVGGGAAQQAPVAEVEQPRQPAPVIDAPVMDAPAPATDAPAMDAPVMDAPVMDAPVMDAPVMDAPAPATDAPAMDAPAPATDAPAEGLVEDDAPAAAPVVAPATDAPAAEDVADPYAPVENP